MAEGLAAVGLAAAVVQFTCLAFKVVTKGYELHGSAKGAVQENDLLETVIKDFRVLLDRMKQSSKPTSQAVQDFRDQGVKLADDMLEGLEKLKVYGPRTKWRTFRKALKAVLGKHKVDSWVQMLNTLRDQFNFQVEIDILEKVDLLELSLSNEFKALDASQQQRLQTLMTALRDAQDVFEQNLWQQLDDIKDSNRSEHQATRVHVDTSSEQTRDVIKSEHETTRVQVDTSHQQTREIIKSEHQTTRQSSIAEAKSTRRDLSIQHLKTRQAISAGGGKLQAHIQVGQVRSLKHSELQHAQTSSTVTKAIVNQGDITEQNLKDDSRQNTEFIEAELFRNQLENERNVRNEHAWNLQVLQNSNARSHAEFVAQVHQSKVELEHSLAVRDHEQRVINSSISQTQPFDHFSQRTPACYPEIHSDVLTDSSSQDRTAPSLEVTKKEHAKETGFKANDLVERPSKVKGRPTKREAEERKYSSDQVASRKHNLTKPTPSPHQMTLRTLEIASHDTKNPNSDFRKRNDPSTFFKVGRVIEILLAKPPGNSKWIVDSGSISASEEDSDTPFCRGELETVRRFVVIREGSEHCTALPIRTYGGQGVARKSVKKCEHAIIYTRSVASSPAPGEVPTGGELGMLSDSIRVHPYDKSSALDALSRIDFGRPYTIDHGHRVRPFGAVREHESNLDSQFQAVWKADTHSTTPSKLNHDGAKAEPTEDDDDDDDS